MNKKYQKIPLVLMGLAGVALLTSGFSTWVISTQDTTNAEQITMQVGEVNDYRLKAVVSNVGLDNSIKLDASGVSAGSIFASEGSTQDLTFGCTVQVGLASAYNEGWKTENYNTAIEAYFNSFSINLVGASNTNDSIKNAYNKALETSGSSASIYGFDLFKTSSTTLVGETISTGQLWSGTTIGINTLNTPKGNTWKDGFIKYSVSAGAIVDNQAYREFTFTFNFAWGDFFSNKNPVQFSPTSTKTLDEAIIRLNNLYAANDARFNVTISTAKA